MKILFSQCPISCGEFEAPDGYYLKEAVLSDGTWHLVFCQAKALTARKQEKDGEWRTCDTSDKEPELPAGFPF
jgi:hypothetical protein